MAIGKYPVTAVLLLTSAIGVNAAQLKETSLPAAGAEQTGATTESETLPAAISGDTPPDTATQPKGTSLPIADTEQSGAATEPGAQPAPSVDTSPATTAEAPKKTVQPKAAIAAPAQSMDMSQVIALLQQQQKDLSEQRKLLETQSGQIKSLQAELDVLRAPMPTKPAIQVEQQEQIVAKTDAVTQPIDTSVSAEKVADTTAPKSKEERREEAKQAGQEVAKAQADDPTRDLLSDFPGAWRLPGTNAALAIGGYVKASVVYNFDPLEIRDRFIVGSIPVQDDSDIEAQSSITASQSRLNFDLREPTKVGLLRAFIEGDFAEENDTFRLRHAFGQWNKILAGKTWSAFVDTEASPEEVDFEGLNGRINVRQSQIRIMPTIGKNYEFQISLEDPSPQLQNGQGVTRAPDVVASGRFQLYDRLHVKLGLLGRQIRGQRNDRQGGGLEKEYAWGTTLSGRFMTPRLDARDSLLFQLNVGNGIGRYVNDLSSVGNFDGIFNPDDGDLELFDIVSGYVSFQHWWKGNLRSNFTLGAVNVNNPGFIEGDAYKSTLRASSNLFWMPTPRIDIGAEYLWGKRENEDGENDTATQIQLAARYRF